VLSSSVVIKKIGDPKYRLAGAFAGQKYQHLDKDVSEIFACAVLVIRVASRLVRLLRRWLGHDCGLTTGNVSGQQRGGRASKPVLSGNDD
jgi:hypothetical protein